MNLLHWHAIRLFRALGVKQYDFVGARINPSKGSKQEGLVIFKERFGGRRYEDTCGNILFISEISLYNQPFAYVAVAISRSGAP